VLLNNHMDDFVLVPGVPNLFKLVAASNAIEPGQAAAVLHVAGRLWRTSAGFWSWAPLGGSRIISIVLEVFSTTSINRKSTCRVW